MSTPLKVLIVEDSEDDTKLALRALRQGGFEPKYRRVQTAADLKEALAQERWDAVISDFQMPGFTGMDALKLFRSTGLDIPFVLVSGTIGEEVAVEAMKAGAGDYLMKAGLVRLAPALKRELKETQTRAALRRDQQALTDSEDRFRRMTAELEESQRIARIGSWVWTPATGAITWSDGMNHVLARDRALPAPNFEELARFYTPESWQRLGAIIATTIETGASYQLDLEMIRADGTTCWTSTRGEAIRGADGAVVQLHGTVHDITEPMQAVEALRTSELEFRTLAEAMPQIVWITRADGWNIYFNQRWMDYTGMTLEESLGHGWNKPFHPDDQQRAWDAWQQATAGIEVYSLEARLRRADGVYRWWLVRGAPLQDATGSIVKWFGTCTDIHDLKMAELEIARANGELRESEVGIRRLNRVYAVLSGINALIVRVRDRDELYKEACRIAVNEGGFRMAWIGIVDKSEMMVLPVATAGVDKQFLAVAGKDSFSLREAAPTSMVARAIKVKKAVVSNDSKKDFGVLFGKKYAESGVRSMAFFPLIVADEAAGVLVLHTNELNFFHEDELKLLTELAGDIAFAIDHIDKQARLDYLAYYDSLTGLANRSLFLERVAQQVRSAASGGHKLAVFLMDLERFKNINDSLGRPAGDTLLRQVAAWLTSSAGDANLLARLDADHFAAVMPLVKEDGDVARAIEKSVEALMNHPFRLNDAVFRIAVKIGVAIFPDDGADADTLFKNAEAALKKAKASGDRYLFYTQKMTEAVAGKLTLETQLRQALDNEEFVLHYQPKVNLTTGKLTSAEALIRWNDPRTGLVPPGRFIPILEETGLIYDVGRWALRQAIADYLRWRAAGLAAVRIAVNVSPLQLRNRGFVAEIEQVIGIEAHAPAGLELEITESLIMEDIKHNIASMQAIRSMGVTIAIDDFGTGFSSLSYLAKLPVDTLKIDRSFVIDMTVAPEGLALVSTIINLAHSLKLKVVAEGVETDAQSRLLRLLNCDEMQGFLYSKPVPMEAFETKFLAPPAAG